MPLGWHSRQFCQGHHGEECQGRVCDCRLYGWHIGSQKILFHEVRDFDEVALLTWMRFATCWLILSILSSTPLESCSWRFVMSMRWLTFWQLILSSSFEIWTALAVASVRSAMATLNVMMLNCHFVHVCGLWQGEVSSKSLKWLTVGKVRLTNFDNRQNLLFETLRVNFSVVGVEG